ncbi:MAG TPA: hypothetical protein VMA75_04395 [Candidatus Paceibacterota bacterium]|nr:hypothetical protein [Candidatus Paceibacterota bacterium]
MESSSSKVQLNSLEKAILQWFAQRYKDENLSVQINTAKLKERKWTKTGFYIKLDVSSDANLVDINKLRKKGWPLDGPEIKSQDIDDGGGSVLWGKDGRITQIELYAYGNSFKENVGKFELSKC